MKLAVLADLDGEVIGAAVYSDPDPSTEPSESQGGSRFVPMEGQTVTTIDPPEELVGRKPGPEYLGVLRSDYVVRDGSLAKRAS